MCVCINFYGIYLKLIAEKAASNPKKEPAIFKANEQV